MTDTALPYGGTSGWSGSSTSRERAERDDADGTTSDRQLRTLVHLEHLGAVGVTWGELASAQGWHHGQASGVLSVLHKEGRICRLTERRNRCAIYVLPDKVYGRETAPHASARKGMTDAEREAVARFRQVLTRGGTIRADDARHLSSILARLADG